MSHDTHIRSMRALEAEAISRLVLEAFDALVAPGCGAEGVDMFHTFAGPEQITERNAGGHRTYVAEADHSLVGMIQIDPPAHIRMLFVRPDWHGRGVARRLVERAIVEFRGRGSREVTVNSSTYAVPAYERLGFRVTGETRDDSGIVCVPMALDLETCAE